MSDKYDLVIMGGGLAGLTLALQIKKAQSNISILILESRLNAAPSAVHKVGESTVELGTHYLRETIGLKDYLDEFQLPKHGLRFFFSPQHKLELSKRVELGPREPLPVPSHQIDRGAFENKLEEFCRKAGADVLLNVKVKDITFGDDFHTIGHEIQPRINSEL